MGGDGVLKGVIGSLQRHAAHDVLSMVTVQYMV